MNLFNSIQPSAIVRWTWALLAVLIVSWAAHAESWHAKVGAQSDDMGRQALAFLPNEIWIHAGDSITWNFVTDEAHTVTFFKPGQIRPPFPVGCPGTTPDGSMFNGSACVNGGRMTKGQTYTVNFPAPGNFKFVCAIHVNMTAVVHVLDPSQILPHDQQFYDHQAAEEGTALLADHDAHHGHQAEDRNEDSSLDDPPRGNGVTAGTGEIVATGGGHQTLSVLRFMEPTIVIHVGETVEWTNSDPVTGHTVTFGTEPPNVTPGTPPSANVTVDTDGALHATINSSADNVHSGNIKAAPQERVGLAQSALGVTRFRVTFTRPGIYPYICAIHDELGMKGQVIVLP